MAQPVSIPYSSGLLFGRDWDQSLARRSPSGFNPLFIGSSFLTHGYDDQIVWAVGKSQSPINRGFVSDAWCGYNIPHDVPGFQSPIHRVLYSDAVNMVRAQITPAESQSPVHRDFFSDSSRGIWPRSAATSGRNPLFIGAGFLTLEFRI